MTTVETNRWSGLAAVTLLTAAVGIATQNFVVLAGAAVPLVFTVYARMGSPPDPDLSVTRSVDVDQPRPGDPVTVTVTVRNEGDSTLTDVRVVDSLPADLGVRSGDPESSAAFRPGAAHTFSYTVTARRGDHEFGDVTVAVQNLGGQQLVVQSVPVETTIECVVPVGDLPLGNQTARSAGRVPTETSGSGLEFYATREYRPSDPRNRVDWRRYARTGELATVEFVEDHAATVVLLVDVHPDAFERPAPGAATAVEYATYAAQRVFYTLQSEGNRVGVALVPGAPEALAPDIGPAHRAAVERLLEEHPALDAPGAWVADVADATADGEADAESGTVRGADSTTAGAEETTDEDDPSDGDEPADPGEGETPSTAADGGTDDPRDLARNVLEGIPGHAQVIVFSPLLSDRMAAVTRHVRAANHDVSVVSPDVTRTDSAGEQLAYTRRRVVVDRLRNGGVPVVDWDPERSLDATLEAASGGLI